MGKYQRKKQKKKVGGGCAGGGVPELPKKKEVEGSFVFWGWRSSLLKLRYNLEET